MKIYQWINKDKERYYNITMEKKESKIALYYQWGSCNTKRGGKKQSFLTENEATKVIEQMLKRRKSRGYELMYQGITK